MKTILQGIFEGFGMRNKSQKLRQSGFTLMELMIVVAIIAIIAAVSYPSYTQFVVRAKRASGTSLLMQVADRQQQFFMDNKRYAANLTSLGYSSDSIMVSDDGHIVTASDDDRVYGLDLTDSTATSFTLTATPQLNQAENDTRCGNLTLTDAGAKGHSGSGEKCW
jgi:type IV pilus assembly protein PilE